MPDREETHELFCWPHNRTHTFTVGDMEVIVYALTAAVADHLTAPEEMRLFAGQPYEPHLPCPREVLRQWADSPELYAEHVEQGQTCRVAHERKVQADA